MVSILTEPTWRSARRRSSKGSRWSRELTSHAVRGSRTLCGIATDDHEWCEDAARRCGDCEAVPPGHATAWDLTAPYLTYRQLDYWTRSGHLQAVSHGQGSGHRRYWPGGEAVVALTMGRLTAAGLTIQAAHRAARNGGWLANGVRVVISSGQDDHEEACPVDVSPH